MSATYRAGWENMDDKYFDKLVSLTNWFRNVKRGEKYSVIDYRATDIKGRECNIELKTRLYPIEYWDTWFIEEKKWDRLKDDYIKLNILPLYINFFQNGDNVCIWNLKPYFDGIFHEPEKKIVTIHNEGYDRIDENEVRYLLPPRDGHFYTFDEQQNKYRKKW